MRKAIVAIGLVLAGTAFAASEPLTVLPRPLFNAPVAAPHGGRVHFVLVSSRSTGIKGGIDVIFKKRFHGLPLLHSLGGLELYGKDGSSARYVVAPGRYAFDFAKYAWPPRYVAADKEFVYEQVVWAKETGGVLYVETAHSTYASSSSGLNAYLNAIDLKTRKLVWRSAALVANANDFVVAGNTIVTGYGFTNEPDYLYALDRRSGRVLARLLLPNAPEWIVRHGARLDVYTYDHHVVVDLQG